MGLSFSLGKVDVPSEEGVKNYDIAIIGSGPAGLTAAIYSGRAGLKTVVLEKHTVGGTGADAPIVENYPPFESIAGGELMSKFKKHASLYADILDNINIKSIVKKDIIFSIETEHGVYEAKGLVLATGTTHRKLNIPGEDEYLGRGVSYCVTCDAQLFKDKDVIVIGGGNSGAIASIYVKNVSRSVKVIEYMNQCMCEGAYIKKIDEIGIEYINNTIVTEILGDGTKVTGIRCRNRTTGEETELSADGVFIYTGQVPQNDVAKMLGLSLNERGYIMTDENMRTSLEFVYAAGDITGKCGQIVMAAGQGAKAAVNLSNDLLKR